MSETRWRSLSFSLVLAGLACAAPAAAQDAVQPAPSAANPPPPPSAPAAPSEGAAGVSLVGSSPAPRVASPATRPEPSEPSSGTPSSGTVFRADFKLPFTTASLVGGNTAGQDPFAAVPQLVLGFQTGIFAVGAGIGFMRLGYSGGGGFSVVGQSITEVLLAPTVTIDAFQSRDHRVAFYLLGAPVFGAIISDQSVNTSTTGSDLGFQFALGANYALHDNFRLGLEVGPIGHFYNINLQGSSSNPPTYSTVSLYTALVGTFAK